MRIEEVIAELEAAVAAGEPFAELEGRLAGLARAAYAARGRLVCTYRCGICVQEKSGRRRRAGYIFETPDGALLFADSSRPEGDGGRERVLFIYQNGLLTIGAGSGCTRIEVAAPLARCGHHGAFLVATSDNPVGRDLTSILEAVRTGSTEVLVTRALGDAGAPFNSTSGQLGRQVVPRT